MPEPRFEILDALAAIDLRVHHLDGARAIVGMLHLHVVERQRFLHGVAEHVRDRGAHALEAAVGVRDGEHVDGQVEEAVELGLGARPAGEIAANGVQRQRHEDEREAAAADDHRLRDPGAALRVELALVEQLDLRHLHFLRERADARLQGCARPAARSARAAAARLRFHRCGAVR